MLKSFAIDDVRRGLEICEEKMKKIEINEGKSSSNEINMLKEIKKISDFSLEDLLNENEREISNFFLNYFGEDIMKKENSIKKTSILEDDNLTKTRSFILDNRNDFIIFILNGEFIKEIDLNIAKIMKISYKNKESQNIFEKFFLKLLNLKAVHEKNKISERDIINKICDINNESLNLKISYDEDVMAAMIETNFFLNNNIIQTKKNLQKFYFFIFDNNYSNKLLNSFLKFIVEINKNNKNFDKIVNTNFDKGNKISKEYKKIEKISPDIEQISNQKSSNISGKFRIEKENNYENETIEDISFIYLVDIFNNNISYDIENKDISKKNSEPIHFKKFNYKLYSDLFYKKISLTKNNNNKRENIPNKIFKIDDEKLINLFYKIFSYKDLNLKKTIISFKILYFACRENYDIRKYLIKKNFLELIEIHIQKYSDEMLVINGLKLFNLFLDPNDLSITDFLKQYDVWDDYIIILINIIINWSFQGIKCSSELICEVLNTLYRISFFSMIEMSKLLTEGYKNEEFNFSNKDFLFDNFNSPNKKIKNSRKKIKFKDFLLYILNDDFLSNLIKDNGNSIIIYEQTILLLIRSNFVDSKIKTIYWINEVNSIIEDKFIYVYNKMEKIIMTYLDLNFIEQDINEIDSEYELSLVYRIYLISLMYFKEIFDEKSLREKMLEEFSPLGMVVRFIHACRNYNRIIPFWEKTKYFHSLIENVENEIFLNLEGIIEKKIIYLEKNTAKN